MAANVVLLREALPGLELELSSIRKVFSEMESFEWNAMHNQVTDGDRHSKVWDEQRFEYRLKRLAQFIEMTLEAADLPLAREQFRTRWDTFKELTDTEWIHDIDVLHSEPLEWLTTTLDGIRVLVTRGQSPVEAADAKRLRDLLEATPRLLHLRGVVPTREKEIQDVMNEYLDACFMGDYTRKPKVSGIIKNFEPDGGVRSLKTAIEFKFVTSVTEMKQAASGIIEDTGGYRGSLDWTNFYSVVYQTEPFSTAAHFRGELKRVDGIQWTPIVVVGRGRKARKKGPGKKAK